MARPVQKAAVCRVDSRVDVLLFEPPAQPVQRSSSLRSRRWEVSCRYHDGLNKERCARGKHARGKGALLRVYHCLALPVLSCAVTK